MIRVSPISRNEIQTWSVEEAGFTIRVVNAVQAGGIDTLAQLRAAAPSRLLNLPHFGKTSLEVCRQFFSLSDELSSGTLRIQSVREWMELYISADGYDVISSRYGFYRADSGASRKFFTLQDIANRTGRSRERIRQVEERSITQLEKRLPRAGLQAVAEFFRHWIETQHGSCRWADMHPLQTRRELDGASPASLVLFLSDLFPDLITSTPGYATLVPGPLLKQIKRAMHRAFETDVAPRPLSALVKTIAKSLPSRLSSDQLTKLLQLELQRSATMVCTRDLQCGPRLACIRDLLKTVLRGKSDAVHYRTLTHLVNQNLVPEQAAGAGTILQALKDPAFQRLGSGTYLTATP